MWNKTPGAGPETVRTIINPGEFDAKEVCAPWSSTHKIYNFVASSQDGSTLRILSTCYWIDAGLLPLQKRILPTSFFFLRLSVASFLIRIAA